MVLCIMVYVAVTAGLSKTDPSTEWHTLSTRRIPTTRKLCSPGPLSPQAGQHATLSTTFRNCPGVDGGLCLAAWSSCGGAHIKVTRYSPCSMCKDLPRGGCWNAQFFPDDIWLYGEPMVSRLSVDASCLLEKLCNFIGTLWHAFTY
jgi:hypothetical protein